MPQKTKIYHYNKLHVLQLDTVENLTQLHKQLQNIFKLRPHTYSLKVGYKNGWNLDEGFFQWIKKEEKATIYIIDRQSSKKEQDLESQNSFELLQEEQKELKMIDQKHTSFYWFGEPNSDDKKSMYIKSIAYNDEEENNSYFAKLNPPKKQERLPQLEKTQVIKLDKPVIKEEVEIKPQRKPFKNTYHQKFQKKVVEKVINNDIKKEEPAVEQKIEPIMDNVQCNICSMFPIAGPIYKCLICKDYDLCGHCQSNCHHFHPTIRITKAIHYPNSIQVTFPQSSKAYMEKRLQKERVLLSQQKKDQLLGKEMKEGVEVDPASLKQTSVRSPNFLRSLVG